MVSRASEPYSPCESYGPPLKAVLFDLDGTLVATEHRSRAAWTTLFRTHNVPCDDRVLASLAGRPGREAIADYAPLFGGRQPKELFDEAIGYLQGPGIPPPEPVRGAEQLVKQLTAARILIAVVTSAPPDQAFDMLTLVGGADQFDMLVTSEHVRRGKPDPEGYLTGCRRLGVSPELSMAVEDTPAGITAAGRAGLRCVGVATTHDRSALGEADLVVADLTELRRELFARQPPGAQWQQPGDQQTGGATR